MTVIVPPTPEPSPTPAPADDRKGKAIKCECCGSTLDRHGNLLRRGDLAKQMIDAEDTIDKLRKQVAKAAEDLNSAQQTISELKAAQPSTKPRSRFSLGADA